MRPVVLVALAALMAGGALRAAFGCATVGPSSLSVAIADEEALIVWNEASKTEHFIRRASFEASGKAKDFGFLVPTPTVPALADVDASVFAKLHEHVVSSIRSEWQVTPLSFFCCPIFIPNLMKGEASRWPVRVLLEDRIAGYDAAVLEADSAVDLAAWLGKNGYESRPSLAAWLEPYVRAHWKITAFKLSAAAPETDITSRTVRLTFKAERPFYPYREPHEPGEGPRNGRQLRVYLVSDRRLDAELEKADGSRGLIIFTEHADGLGMAAPLVEAVVPAGQVPANAWLTVLLDISPWRGSSDIVFVTASDQSPYIESVHHEVWVPLDLIFLVVGVLWWRRRRRARLANSPPG